MARAAFILGIWILAVSLGILGYQVLTFYFYQKWPPVSLGSGWQEVVSSWQLLLDLTPSDPPRDELGWVGRVPLVPVGIIFSYALFLLSDGLRGRSGRRAA